MGQPKKRCVEPPIIERDEARRVGLARYFTGRPCKNGHVSERLVSNATCLDCMLENNARGRQRDPERFKRYSKETGTRFLERNPDYLKQQYAKHQDRFKARASAHQRDNPDMARARRARWKRKNPEWAARHSAARRAALAVQTPRWLTAEQIAEIDAIYHEAATRPGGPWHVDHIVPVRSPKVCGLHVPWNLRIVAAAENMKKGNRLVE